MGESSKSLGTAGGEPPQEPATAALERVRANALVGRTPDPEVLRAAEAIVGLFRRAGRALRASDFDAPGEWAAALTMPQLRVLYLLGRHKSLPVGSVAEAMRISQPSATETIDRLVRAGYVSRTTCTADRRVVRTALTEAGRTLIDRPWEARRALLADALAAASPTQREAVAHGLETLCALLAESPSPSVSESSSAMDRDASSAHSGAVEAYSSPVPAEVEDGSPPQTDSIFVRVLASEDRV